MTSMAPAGEGGGGGTTAAATTTTTTMTTTAAATTTTTSAEQAPSPSAATPVQHPPPSPLSGCYLLVVLPEPHTAQHKDLILNRLAKGFLSWDKESCHVGLEKELQALVTQAPEGEEARNGERLIQYATENLVTEVLIYPQSNTLLQCMRNLLASFTKHRHIIHAGYTFGGNGSWILQDGTFSIADFLDAFSEHEVQRVLRAYENSVTVDIHCAGVGDWTTVRLSKEACTRACRVRVNPDDVLTAGEPIITSFINYIGQYLIPQTLDQLMEPSDVVGNIRFSHPTLYVFPGGQGDAALFGINGFNMLVDGGFARKACFWDFARHLDRLDAVLVTRINNSNIGGMSSVLRKKKETHVYPQIGHFFCNLVERRHSNSPDGDKDIDPLILNLIDIGQEMMVNLRHINLRPHPCYRDPEPINLYHKVGHGTLDMYVLSPNKDSREVREFLAKWNASDSKLFAGSHRKDSNSLTFPIQNLVSICALLVWQPANPEDTITRILFPGSTPQHKIFEGFQRLKHLEFLKHPVCTAKSLSPSTSLITLKEKAAILKPKLGSIERETKRLAELKKEKRDFSENRKKDPAIDESAPKITSKQSIPPQMKSAETKARKVVENRKIESETKESKVIDRELKEMKKEVKKTEKSERTDSETKKTDAAKIETEKTVPIKGPKIQKTETKKKDIKELVKPAVKANKPEIESKPIVKSAVDKKSKPAPGEKKDIPKASPTTPKKSINGSAVKAEISRTAAKSAATKSVPKAPSSVPAKSAKDANNRMVVEQKNNELSSMTAGGAAKAPAKSRPVERKPISRRTKPLSPTKRLPISPAKSAKSTPTASVKSEKDAVIRKIRGGTTDSSAVSTPSVGTEPAAETAVKLIDKNLTEKSEDMSLDSIESKVLADLKEEREVVEEIEAVLQKAERIEEARKEGRLVRTDEAATDKKEEEVTEDEVTADIDDKPEKISRKESQELTEEDEYLIVEKEEIYTEDSVQSGDAEHKHHLDEVESEKTKIRIEGTSHAEVQQPEELEEDKEYLEEKKDEIPEKELIEEEAKKSADLTNEHKELLKEEMKQIIASATEVIQKTAEEKDDSTKRDSEDITKEPSSLSPDKLDSPVKPDLDQKEIVPEKLEESQERISTLESGATTTAPTLPEDERIPLDEIKEDVDEKHAVEEVKEKDVSPVVEKEVIPEIPPAAPKPEVKVLDVKPAAYHGIPRDVVKTPDEVADLPVHEEVDPKLYRMDDLEKDKDAKAPSPPQEKTKESPTTPQVKESKDKGVFSFFGKVADKFEKGIDKLTKKARRDSSDKDAEDKSSKSSSPKELKSQEKVIHEISGLDKVSPIIETVEKAAVSAEEKAIGTIASEAELIKETKSFLHEEIKDSELKTTTQIEAPAEKVSDLHEAEILGDAEAEPAEDIQEVEALVEEASKKFKNVKDSLQDSLESLEDKVIESKEVVAETLTGVVEKLEDIPDAKEPEKVKFVILPGDDMEEEENNYGSFFHFKEAVRDVADVLAGTAGIDIEREIETKGTEYEKAGEKDPEVGLKDATSPGKSQEIDEEICTKVVKEAGVAAISPVRDAQTDKEDAKRICDDILKDEMVARPCVESEVIPGKPDVVELGLEEICIKKVAKREILGEKLDDEKMIVESEIGFEQKLSPGKAELVTVTPGSTPTSPKVATELSLPELPKDYKDIFDKDTSLENIMEEFIVAKKYKITTQILEYIVIKLHVPKHKVIYIIQEIILRYKIPRESVVDNIQILRTYDNVSLEQRMDIENYVINEYFNKNKKISSTVIEEISEKMEMSKSLIIEIIEEIIVRRKVARETVFDISGESYFAILKEDLEKMSEKVEGHHDAAIESEKMHEKPVGEQREEIQLAGSDEMEDDEKFVQETVEKEKDRTVDNRLETHTLKKFDQEPSQDLDVSEVSESDAKEKYLDEAKEKTMDTSLDKNETQESILENQEGTVRRMVVTASSEDGGHEIEICPTGTITFSIDKSDADAESEKKDEAALTEKSSVVEKESERKSSIALSTLKSEDNVQFTTTEVIKTPDSLQSGDASPAESVFFKSPSEKSQHLDSFSEHPSSPITDHKTEDINFKTIDSKSKVDVEIETKSDVKEVITVAEKSRSPSVDKESKVEDQNVTSGEFKELATTVIDDEARGKPKSPTIDKDVEIANMKETLLEGVDADLTCKKEDQTQSPCAEKDMKKEDIVSLEAQQKEQDSTKVGKEDDVKEQSKSPSVEKDEVSTASMKVDDKFIIDSQTITDKVVDKSKSPSAERDMLKTDDENLAGEIEDSTEEKSKSPAERCLTKEQSPPKSIQTDSEKLSIQESFVEEKTDDQFKSLSMEKDVVREPSPAKSAVSDDEKLKAESTTLASKAEDRSKSPSAERETPKEGSPPKSTVSEDLKSKVDDIPSPGKQKDASRESSPTKSLVSDDEKSKADIASKTEDHSKSPSAERESLKEGSPPKSTTSEDAIFKVDDILSSGKEKDASREPSPAKSVATDDEKLKTDVPASISKAEDHSKSPSVERETLKEGSPPKSTTSEDAKSKADDILSPGKEKDTSREPSPAKSLISEDVKSKADAPPLSIKPEEDHSKSPSVEKDATREPSPAKSLASDDGKSKAEASSLASKTEERSKSPSVEKDVSKEGSPPKSTASDDLKFKAVDDSILENEKRTSKSPSVDQGVSREPSPAKSLVSDDEKLKTDGPASISKLEDRSKSPSAERDVSKEGSPPKSTASEDLKSKADEIPTLEHEKDASKSPSIERDVTKEPSPAKSVVSDDEKSKADASSLASKAEDRSKSPSAERETPKEGSPPKSTISEDAKSKADDIPSLGHEKEASREASPAKSLVSDDEKSKADIANKVEDHSKSPSAERETPKEGSPPKSTASEDLKSKAEDILLPGKEKDTSREPSPAKSGISEDEKLKDATSLISTADHSKSPSVERDISKESSPAKSITAEDIKSKSDDIQSFEIEKHTSKSPSVEREETREPSPAKSGVSDDEKSKADTPTLTSKADDRSKSPSAERDTLKEGSPPKSITSVDKPTAKTEEKAEDRSKSPSTERDASKIASPKDKSKSPSVEKEETIETSASKLLVLEDNKLKTEESDKVQSMSPTTEKQDPMDKEESHPDVKSEGRSKSTSVEKDTLKEESFVKSTSEEHSFDGEISTKSPIAEKDVSKIPLPSESVIKDQTEVIDQSKSTFSEIDLSIVKTTVTEIVAEDTTVSKTTKEVQSKSPSSEREVSKEGSPAKSETVESKQGQEMASESRDRSKSPSAEKDMTREGSPAKSITSESEKAQAVEVTVGKIDAIATAADEKLTLDEPIILSEDRSKSPSVEKDFSKEGSPAKTITENEKEKIEESKDKSRSPSAERKSSKILDATADSVSVAKQADPLLETKDKSKSPSVEKEIVKVEDATVITESVERTISQIEILDKSQPSGTLEDTMKKDPEDENSHEKYADDETKIHSKSPSVERDSSKDALAKSESGEIMKSDEKIGKDNTDDKSKSPSVERDASKTSPAKSPISIKEEKVEETTEMKDASKSPSLEKEISKKESLAEVLSVSEGQRGSVSQSGDKEVTNRESSPAKSDASVEDDKLLKEDTVEKDASKSPTPEKDDSRKEEVDVTREKSPSIEDSLKKDSPDKLIASDDHGADQATLGGEIKDKSKSPSVEWDVDVAKSAVPIVVDSLAESAADIIVESAGRSKSPSVERDSDTVKERKDSHKSKSPSPERLTSEQMTDSHMEKPRSSIMSDKFDTDSLDRTKSPSIMSDKSDEKDIADRSKSPSVVGDKHDIGQIDDVPAEIAGSKSRSSSISGSAPKDFEVKSRSASSTEKQPMSEHDFEKAKSASPVGERAQASVDERKSSVGSVSSYTEEKARSRSHSLFDAGDKTPLVRSRAASLYEDKAIEKLSVLEHSKDPLGHAGGIFEEEGESHLSRESLHEMYADSCQRVSQDGPSSDLRKSIKNHILNEYVHKNKVITYQIINQLSATYNVNRCIIVEIINEIIIDLKIDRSKVIHLDQRESEEISQKMWEDEAKLMDYINHEFIMKKKRIDSKTIEEIAAAKSVSSNVVTLVIENIISLHNLRRESVLDVDISREEAESMSTSRKTSINKDSRESLLKSKSVSPSPEPDRSEPHIDEEVTISENKREEVETLLLDDYISKGTKINRTSLEQIINRTSLPKYIIVEIIEEILLKRHMPRTSVADESIFSDTDGEDTQQQRSETTESSQLATEVSAHKDRSGKDMPDAEYESPFHKAFMGGMTEIRTTHITTLSDKSTLESAGPREDTASPGELLSTITTTIKSLPAETADAEVGDEAALHGKFVSSEIDSKLDKKLVELTEAVFESRDRLAQDTVVILKTTQITTSLEGDKEATAEFLRQESTSAGAPFAERTMTVERSTIETSQGSSSGRGESAPDEITEVIVKKITKTIVEGAGESVSTSTTEQHSKVLSGGEATVASTVSPFVAESEEKLISLESQSGESEVEVSQAGQKVDLVKDLMDHTITEQRELLTSPLIRDLASESYSGKSSPDVSLPKDIVYGSSPGKSTPELSMSPLIRDGSLMQSHFSGRSTPDRKSAEHRSSRTATPEGFRSGDVIRTIITTTRTMSEDGEIITTTQEVTETTNEKGETIVLATKTDVTVDDKLPEHLLAEEPPRTASPEREEPASPRSDLSSGHSRAATHIWGSSEERHTYSDDEAASPPQSARPSAKDQFVRSSDDFASAAMTSSFYGKLPEDFEAAQDFAARKLTVEKEYAGGYTEKDSRKYRDDADLDFEKALTGLEAGKVPSGRELEKAGQSDEPKDPLAGWSSPLGLPSPRPPRKFNLRSPVQGCSSADLSPDSLNFDVINDWGEPMRLPSPAATGGNENKAAPGTPKKESAQIKKVLSENLKNKKRSESPSKNDKRYKDSRNKVQPVYVDLTYVSHHGNSFYTALDFFKKVRARYYVFSGTEPSREVYDALLEAKKTWEDKDLEVTIIPTYDTDTLGYWVADNEEALSAQHIDLSPSASRCTINLQDHETSCSAYRLEF